MEDAVQGEPSLPPVPLALRDELLSRALADRPGWMVAEREEVRSFQQYLERVIIHWFAPEERAGHSEVLYLRIYRGFMSWWSLASPDLPEREQTAWRVAESAGIAVPETLLTVRSAEITAAVQYASPGQAVYKVPMTDALAVSLGEMLAQVHRAPVDAEARCYLPNITLGALFPRLIAWAEEAGADELAASARQLQDTFAREIVELPPAFLHGDFHIGNVLADDDAVTAVIDWEEAALGDPRLDVCVMAHVLQRHAPGYVPIFLAVYEAVSGTTLGPLELWRELGTVRSRIVGAWVKNAVAQGQALPTANPAVWY